MYAIVHIHIVDMNLIVMSRCVFVPERKRSKQSVHLVKYMFICIKITHRSILGHDDYTTHDVEEGQIVRDIA